MILVHFGGLFSWAEVYYVRDDFGNEHEYEALILADDPALDISPDAFDAAVRFIWEGMDEWQPLDEYTAAMFVPRATGCT